MRNVEIEIFNIAKTAVQPKAVIAWLDHIGTSVEYQDELSKVIVEDNGVTDPALLIAIAAKRCYMSFEPGLNPNVTKVRADWTAYLDNVLKQGHGSVLEHSVYTFAIEGVSRVFTGEMNRHRAGVGISEGSMRFIRYEDIPWWLPTSITLTEREKTLFDKYSYYDGTPDHDLEDEDQATLDMAWKKIQTQQSFKRVFEFCEKEYGDISKIWSKELSPESKFAGKKHVTSMMRRIIPMGVATGGVWTMNMRAVRHIMAMRASAAAEEEILLVFSKIAKFMVETEPMLCGDFSQTTEGYWIPKYPKV